MKNKVLLVWIIILSFVLSTNLISQGKGQKSLKKKRRWSISVHYAHTLLNPASDIEKAMIASGFNETYRGQLGNYTFTKENPFSETHSHSWMIDLRYLFPSPFSLGLIVSDSFSLGYTHGFHEPHNSLHIRYFFKTYGAVVWVDAEWIRFGMGPAYYVAKTKEVMSFPEKVRENSRLGILFDFALTLPVRTRFYIELNFQYRLAGKMEIGPYEARVPSYATDGDDPIAIFPSVKVSYNHWISGIGIGFRF